MTVPRETSPLEALHGGWPFGPGPDQWRWYLERRGSVAAQSAGVHVCCAECKQSVTRVGKWAMSWESLKPQIALHVMQVHSEHVTG